MKRKVRRPSSAAKGKTHPLAGIDALTPEKIKEALAEGQKRIEERQKRRDRPHESRTGTCVVCGGQVIGSVTREYRGDPMRRIIGPGSINQMTTVHHGWHCTKCGLKYQFPPNEIDPKTARKCPL